MTLPKRSYMKVTGLALACSSLLFSCAPKEVPQVNLIPKPAHIEVTGGYFKVDSNLVFGNDQQLTLLNQQHHTLLILVANQTLLLDNSSFQCKYSYEKN